MKPQKPSKETQALSRSVGRAVRRAAKAAWKTARMHNTPIYIWKAGAIYDTRTRTMAEVYTKRGYAAKVSFLSVFSHSLTPLSFSVIPDPR